MKQRAVRESRARRAAIRVSPYACETLPELSSDSARAESARDRFALETHGRNGIGLWWKLFNCMSQLFVAQLEKPTRARDT